MKNWWKDEPLILASASPRRRQLLEPLGIPFEVVTRPCVESESTHLTACELARLNAHRKASAVAALHPQRVILGSDTVVSLDGVSFGKPNDLVEAASMIQRLQGRTHEVVTGLCLLRRCPHRSHLFFERTFVTFRPLNAHQIRRYLDVINPLDKAGAYAIQEHGELIIERIQGSYTNVVGLPVERVESVLRQWCSGGE